MEVSSSRVGRRSHYRSVESEAAVRGGCGVHAWAVHTQARRATFDPHLNEFTEPGVVPGSTKGRAD